jgi:tripeptide aminopeptidase
VRIAGAVIASLPKDMAPETTKDREGFIHPTGMSAVMEKARLSFIIRDFTEEGLKAKETVLEETTRRIMKDYPGSRLTSTVKEQYRQMEVELDQHPEIVENAVEAIRRAGMTPVRGSIRGGTDGSRLSFMGLPCANIFAGGHAFHSPLEFVSRQDMDKAVATIVELARIWEERA